MKTNTVAERNRIAPRTHEGAIARRINHEQELRRTVMACLLWEDTFYEDGISVTDRITSLIPKVGSEKVSAIAIEAREKMKLRHVPLFLCREMARHKMLKAETLARVIQRADELAEYVSLYWKPKKESLSAQSKKGLALAFQKFDAYALGKYNRDGAVKLRDVLFLSHAKPKDQAQEVVWKQLVDGTLPIPDTWEVAISAAKAEDKKAVWERLLSENKLGALALLRNLRNFKESGVRENLILNALENMKTERVLPFRFIAAARYAPQWEPQLEAAMLRALGEIPKLPGKTAIVIDHSGSMDGAKVSAKSELNRFDAACALAILIREVCQHCVVIAFSDNAAIIPSRRGFGLRDAIHNSMQSGSTNTEHAIQLAKAEGYDRIIVVTDEQSHQSISGPGADKKGYFVNVSIHQNGIGYGPWTHIDGWSESILSYISAAES